MIWSKCRYCTGVRFLAMGEETYDLEGGNGEMAFSDKTVRRGFIKKVYAIISVQVRLDQNKSLR